MTTDDAGGPGGLEAAGLVGRTFGPFALAATADRVGGFVDAIGEHPGRWSAHAPPAFANVALFAAAPAFLDDPQVVPFTRALIHSEQGFRWHRALAIGETLEVAGTVAAVRARGTLNLVTFDLTATGDRGPWLDGTSVFLMADAAAAEADDEPEPPVGERPERTVGREGDPLPAAGEHLEPFSCAASRGDLVRYAAASGDFNPIHWDHAAARAAGLPGVVVHGLLMASWMASAVLRHTTGPDPLREMRVRFRKPLRPGVAAGVEATVGEEAVEVALVVGSDRLVTGQIRVTP